MKNLKSTIYKRLKGGYLCYRNLNPELDIWR